MEAYYKFNETARCVLTLANICLYEHNKLVCVLDPATLLQNVLSLMARPQHW
jgi:hypothetical protein